MGAVLWSAVLHASLHSTQPLQPLQKYHFRADNNALAYVAAPVNGFSFASFMDIAIHIARTS